MPIGFRIIKRPNGWRLGSAGRLDLSAWDIEYIPAKITCTPKPIEFVTMAIGAIVFIFLALFIAASALNVRWLSGPSKTNSGDLRVENGANASPAVRQVPGDAQAARSKFERDRPSLDETRQLTSHMLDELTKDMTVEEHAKFTAALEERSLQRAIKPARRFEGMISRSILVARILAIIPVTLFSLIGGVCLHRALLHFRDKIELSVRQNAIVLVRPKLFGGTLEQIFPLEQLAAITCYAVRHTGGRKGVGAYSQWCTKLATKSPDLPSIEFDLEHLRFDADLTSVTQRVRDFASAIAEMSDLPVLVRRHGS